MQDPFVMSDLLLFEHENTSWMMVLNTQWSFLKCSCLDTRLTSELLPGPALGLPLAGDPVLRLEHQQVTWTDASLGVTGEL